MKVEMTPEEALNSLADYIAQCGDADTVSENAAFEALDVLNQLRITHERIESERAGQMTLSEAA